MPMFDAGHSRRPETDQAQKQTRPMQRCIQQTGDLTRIPLYTQAWGNQPPPWLRLPIQRQELQEGEPGQERDEPPTQRMENTTGLPDTLKAGVERLSGLSMDDVQVHYSSSQPAQVQALAYTQGTDIHMAPGQEEHLPHEAWHVVQQKQERVKPTWQTKDISINDDAGLEREADVMGARAGQEGDRHERDVERGADGYKGEVLLDVHTSSSSINTASIQRKPVPKLMPNGKLKWYDDQDPTQTLYDSEFEASLHSLSFPSSEASEMVPIFDIRRLDISRLSRPTPTQVFSPVERERLEFLKSYTEESPILGRLAKSVLAVISVDEAERIMAELWGNHLLDYAARDPNVLSFSIRKGAKQVSGLLNDWNHNEELLSRLLHWVSFDKVLLLRPLIHFGPDLLERLANLDMETINQINLVCANSLFKIRFGIRIRNGLTLANFVALMQQPLLPDGLWALLSSPIEGREINAVINTVGAAHYVSLLNIPGIHLNTVHFIAVFGNPVIPTLAACTAVQLNKLVVYFPLPPQKLTVAAALLAGGTVARVIDAVEALANNSNLYIQLLGHGLTIDDVYSIRLFGGPGLQVLMATLNALQMRSVGLACDERLQRQITGKLLSGLTALNLWALSIIATFPGDARKLVEEPHITGNLINAVINAIGPAHYAALLNHAALSLTSVHAAADFGAAWVPTLTALSSADLTKLLFIFNSPTKRNRAANFLLIPAATMCAYLQAEIGASGFMGKLSMATNGAQIINIVNGIGQPRYATLLAHLNPAQIEMCCANQIATVTDETVTLIVWLLGRNFTAANIQALRIPHFAVAQDQRGCDAIRILVQSGANMGNVIIFLNNHAAIATTQNGLNLIQNLFQRQGATWTLVDQAINNLPATFSSAQKHTLVSVHLANLSINLLNRRLTEHGLPGQVPAVGVLGGVMMAPALMFQQMQQDLVALNQSMNVRHIPLPIQQEVRIAFQARNWRANQVTTFFGNVAVTPLLPLANLNQNPAHWLYLFAIHHRGGALPVGGVALGLPYAQVYPIGNISITQASIDHIREGHTWENFLFTVGNINRTEFSTLFNAGVTNQELFDRLSNALQNPAAVRDGDDISVGAIQIFLWHFNEVRTMYFYVPATGTRVPRNVLLAMLNNNLF
nr:DUF4157 domain-containing protein [Ktedonobacteraceae bacterium]